MYEQDNPKMQPEEELVEILLDFIIVSANLAKKVNKTLKLKEGGKHNVKNQRNGYGNHRAPHCSDFN